MYTSSYIAAAITVLEMMAFILQRMMIVKAYITENLAIAPACFVHSYHNMVTIVMQWQGKPHFAHRSTSNCNVVALFLSAAE